MSGQRRIDSFDGVARPVIALSNDYPAAYMIPAHHHRRGQLLYGASGAILVSTQHGAWVVPPQCAVWIPPGIEHSVRTLGHVRTQSLYLEPDAAAVMPSRCTVVGISAFMRNLLSEAVMLPIEYEWDSRADALMTLIRHEMRQLPVLPLSLPFPATEPLARKCRDFVANPTPHETIDQWCAALAMSRRSFTRLFRSETGLSFAAWCRQACLIAALPRLVTGEAITVVALDLGYDNPAAFTTMFKRALGASPRAYRKHHA